MSSQFINLTFDNSENTKNENIHSLFLNYWKFLEKYPNSIDLGMGMPDPKIFAAELSAESEFIEGIQLYQADYQHQAGDKNLREEFANFESKRTGISYTAENVMLVSGALRGFSLILDCLGKKDIHIIEVVPTYPLLAGQVRHVLKQVGGTLTTITPQDSKTFQITLDEILPHIKYNSIIYLTNPNNPTGLYIPEGILSQIITTCESVGAYIIIDEACDISLVTNNNKNFLDSPAVIRILSLSKTYLLAGFRLGYIVANDELIERFASHYSFSDGNAPLVANKAILKYLNNPRLMPFTSEIVSNQVKLVIDRLSKCDSIIEFIQPEGCFYIFLKIKTSHNSWLIFQELLARGINVVPGCLFGINEEPWIRICCCRDADILTQYLDKLCQALDTL